MRRFTTLIATALTSTALMGTVATVGLVLDPAVAEANNGNGNGKGNGRNEDRGNSGERGNSANARNNNAGGNRGAMASELRNLNALCANENAFANASDDSNIGQIRTYQTASANVAQYEDAISAALGGAEVTDESVAQLAASYDAAITAKQGEIDAALAADAEADVSTLEAELQALISSRGVVSDYQEADDERDEALMVVTRGRTLSDEAQAYVDAGCQR